MSIKDIFTLVDVYDDAQPAAQVAVDLAARTGAHVTGVAVAMEPLAPGYMASPIPADYIAGAIEEAERQARTASERFSRLAADAGIACSARTATVLAGATAPIVGQAHLSDLVVIAQENEDQPEPMRGSLIEAMMFEAAVPLMLVPNAWRSGLTLDKAIVAWDGSSTAARAVHAALPVLCMTKNVEITIVAGAKLWSGEPGSDVATYLARHGLDVTINLVNREAGDVGATLISHIRETGADYCVMGAYGHSRLREFIVGGATRTMLESMIVPTMMAH